MSKITDIKTEFPIFQHHRRLSYLDNAATTQKPRKVLQAETDFYEKTNANIHRGTYQLSEEASEAYENARTKIANFLNASAKEIIFTPSTTQGLNGLAYSLHKQGILTEKTSVILSELEHHANMLPWREHSDTIHYLPLIDYQIDLRVLEQKLTELNEEENIIISLSLTSNVTGANLDIEQLQQLLTPYREKVILVLDAAQAVAHQPLDVKSLDADFLVFSGHKMYGPTGIGVLYGKQELLEKLPPFFVGGGMITEVSKDTVNWATLPYKFEAGTPPAAQAIGLAAATEFLTELGWENIQEQETSLNSYLYKKLSDVESIELFHPDNVEKRGGVFSFNLKGVHPHDLAEVLAEEEVAVRAGHHCAHVLHKQYDLVATTRASTALYNTITDIDKLIQGILKAQNLFANA